MVHISVVVPMFNEELIVPELIKRVSSELEKISASHEIVIIDDGSHDKTWDQIVIESKKFKNIRAFKLSKNFGHHYAISAGLHNSNGDWVVVMDGDLQDRPEVIPDLYKKAIEGFDVVFVSRVNRPESIFYKMLQKTFYKLLTVLSGIKWDSRQANFSIISRKVVEAFKEFPENARFYGSTIKWLGFDTTFIEAQHGTRFKGKPSYTFRKRIKLALDIIIAFSDRPLRFAIGLGIVMSATSLFSFLLIMMSSYANNTNNLLIPTLISILILVFGIIFIILGIIGTYLGRVFTEVKNRPLYIISNSAES
jgi:dolichol-phosphate mannosyltransferase